MTSFPSTHFSFLFSIVICLCLVVFHLFFNIYQLILHVRDGPFYPQVNDLDAWAGCVAGAMEKSAYLSAIKNAGFKEVKIVSETSSDCEISEGFTGKIVSAKIEAKK